MSKDNKIENPYIVGQYLDGVKIVSSGCGGFHAPSNKTYYWCELENGEFRDTSVDDVPLNKQIITIKEK